MQKMFEDVGANVCKEKNYSECSTSVYATILTRIDGWMDL